MPWRNATLAQRANASATAALLRAGGILDQLAVDNLAGKFGNDTVRRALEEPLKQIMRNSGTEPAPILRKVRQATGSTGYKLATEAFGDRFDMGVIDPTKVTRLGLQNAASIARLILTTDCVIVEMLANGGALPQLSG